LNQVSHDLLRELVCVEKRSDDDFQQPELKDQTGLWTIQGSSLLMKFSAFWQVLEVPVLEVPQELWASSLKQVGLKKVREVKEVVSF